MYSVNGKQMKQPNNVKHLRYATDNGKPKHSKKILYQCRFVLHKSYIVCFGTESELQRSVYRWSNDELFNKTFTAMHTNRCRISYSYSILHWIYECHTATDKPQLFDYGKQWQREPLKLTVTRKGYRLNGVGTLYSQYSQKLSPYFLKNTS
jgi:hypothetical protein